MEENTPHKKKRKDVSQRLEDNKDKEFTCVKMSWNSLVKNNCLKTGIQNIVLNMSKISFLSYKLINYHFTRLLQENKPLPILNQNLFYQACIFVSVMENKKSTIDTNDEMYISSTHFLSHLTKLPFRDKMGALINNLNKQQLTMTQNHLKLNFYKRFHKYLELRTGETRKSVIYSWLKDIYAKEYNPKIKNPFILSMRQLVKYPPTEVNIIKYSSHFIRVYYKILQTFEKYENTKGVRNFNLLPNKHSFTMENITICNTGLNDIISYLTNKPNLKDFDIKKRQYWTEFFNIEKYETINKSFAYAIMTDGNCGVIRLQKPKQEEIKIKDIQNIEYQQIVGIDPGVKSLYTSCNEKGDVLQMTTKQYRHNSKMIYACKKREKWYKKWNKYEIWRNIPTFKTSNLQKMLHYFEYVFPNLNSFFEFHKEKNFRGLSFTSYCRSKSALQEICKTIAYGKVTDKNENKKRNKYLQKNKTLVGFGDYSQQHGLVKKHAPTPILKLKKELRRVCDVVEIDEYRTSKTCHQCFEEITLYKNMKMRKDKKARMSYFHSVICCRSNKCKLCCMDRDINASKNILLLLKLQKEGKRRPKCFLPVKNTCDTTVKVDKQDMV
jgi:transposase